MKNNRISILALSMLAGGMFAASAADMGNTYGSQIAFGPTTNWGKNTPFVYSPDNPPVLNNTAQSDSELVGFYVDGSGKIDGAMILRWYLDDTRTNYVDLATAISGKMGTKANASTVTVALKGSGRTQTNGTHTSATAALNFTGTVVPAVATSIVTRTNYETIGTNSANQLIDLFTTLPIITSTNSTISSNTAWATYGRVGGPFVITNVALTYYNATNTFDVQVTGNYTGTINTGIKGAKPIKLTAANGAATLEHATAYQFQGIATPTTGSGEYVYINSAGTFGFAGNNLQGHSMDIEGTVIEIGKKVYELGTQPFSFNGSGSVNPAKSTYTLNLVGFGTSRGSKLSIAGKTMAVLPISYDTGTLHAYTNGAGGTNWLNEALVITNSAVNGISTADTMKGTAYGQKVTATGGTAVLPQYPALHIP